MDDFFEQDSLTIGSKGLVFIGDEILVYQRDNKTSQYPQCIDLPGGAPEDGETPFETFRREVEEEFSLQISKEQVSYARLYPSSVTIGKHAWFVAAMLPATSKEQIHLGNEGLEYYLMSVEGYLARDDAAWPVLQARTRDYLAATQRSA